MVKMRPEEHAALLSISNALKVEVRHHDDQSGPGMPDLKIIYPDGRSGLVEVLFAVDEEAVESHSVWQGKQPWVVSDLKLTWWVTVEPHARVKELHPTIEKLLPLLEECGSESLHGRLSQEAAQRVAEAKELGLVRCQVLKSRTSGRVHPHIQLSIDKMSGFISDSAEGLCSWLEEFLARRAQRDVATKLRDADADERHVFVVMHVFPEPDFAVAGLLMDDEVSLPTQDPALPHGITHVWIMNVLRLGRGLRWSQAQGWAYFEKEFAERAVS